MRLNIEQDTLIWKHSILKGLNNLSDPLLYIALNMCLNMEQDTTIWKNSILKGINNLSDPLLYIALNMCLNMEQDTPMVTFNTQRYQ